MAWPRPYLIFKENGGRHPAARESKRSLTGDFIFIAGLPLGDQLTR